jgi:PIN domain nuclease of toxin-antitoxin system
MNLLLDTHVAIWAVTEPERIPRQVQRLLEDQRNTLFVSAVSIMEVAIKRRKGGKSAPKFSSAQMIVMCERFGLLMLNLTAAHAAALEEIALAHADPFDRLILAQALAEPMRLVTADSKLAAYSDTIITW